ncbi:MAG TPA: ATP-dependent DNA helicase [Burkholderiaceae bacterium]|nr:ATP-dependent DNA helicase [Burkholderiaceae bacterium]
MALAVATAIQKGDTLVVEAGTGVGKTYAYLVPALLSGERVIISTATKTLQDQLFGRDLPNLVNMLGLPVKTALLKGRSSYLCTYRLELARQDFNSTDRGIHNTLAKVETWSLTTENGDLAELSGLDERSPVLPYITSSRENCLGSQCPKFRNCHVNMARREALAADVVVINHHLFFADLAVRDSGMAELLPTVRVVIFDEAHQLNETGVQFLGALLGTAQIIDLARDVLTTGLLLARGLCEWRELASDLEKAARDLRLSVGKHAPGTKLRWVNTLPENVDEHSWIDALEAISTACEKLDVALRMVSELGPDFVRLQERCSVLQERTALFKDANKVDTVRWLEVGQHIRLIESPLDIAHAVQSKMLKRNDPEVQSLKAWIFASATLGHDANLSWFTEPCGLTQSTILQVESPFNYAQQAAIFVPKTLPKPSDPTHSLQVAMSVVDAIRILQGRTLILTTTLKAMRVIGERLQQVFDANNGIEILIQGQQTKRELLDRFREGSTQGRAGCVLVASASFWEGVDVPGDELALVVIDKLPFPPPNDPLVEARSKRLEAQGRSAFNDYFVPEACVALKQGAGRLIRRETDIGVLMICDTRLTQMGYGRRILAALPSMRLLQNEDDLKQTLMHQMKHSQANQESTKVATSF